MILKEYPFDKYGSSKIRVIADSDCACEGDDAFALAHILITSKFDVQAVTAANFRHQEDSVQKSYIAVRDLLESMDMLDHVRLLKGSLPMRSESDFDISEASEFIVEEAMKDDPRPLFVCVQGAITNIAVALKMKPEIGERIHCIWIGGAPYPKGGEEFNLSNDVIAARVVMDSNMSLWQVPLNVYSMMHVSFMTLWKELSDCGKPGRYLCEQLWNFNHYMQEAYQKGFNPFFDGDLGSEEDIPPELYCGFGCGEAWVLGDSPVVGLMLNAHLGERKIMGAPYINDDSTYKLRPDNPRKIVVYHSIDSQFILNDFFAKMRYQYCCV